MAGVRIYVTDRVTVESGEQALEESAFPRRQGRLAFAYLVLEHHRPVPRDELADALWPEGPPPTWEKSIAAVLSKVRAALTGIGLDGASMLVNAFGCYQLHLPDGAWIDAFAASDELARAEDAMASGEHAAAESSAVVADRIGSSTFLPGDEGAWIDRVRAQLRDVSLRALDVMADARIAMGSPDRAIEAAARAVGLEPFRESSWLRLMRAHAARGDRAEALRIYERCRTVLSDELGTDPSPETTEFFLSLLREQPAAASRGDTLPHALTSFVGRAAECDEVVARIGSARLVTIAGTGGAGKTRLAIESADRARSSFVEGAWMVDLSVVTDPALIIERIASALGSGAARPADGRALAATLDGRSMLVVLDNCEHLVETCAAVVRTLLEHAHGPTVLATSRVPLGITGEHVIRLGSLGEEDSVRLFAERATSVRPDVMLDHDQVASLCGRLDGIPLAIEMAAARAATMSVAEIDEHLRNRSDLLTAGAGNAPRHRTMEATLDWSYGLLSEGAQRALRVCSIFEGSFTLDDATAVAGGPVDLHALAQASLVMVGERDGRTWYRMLELVKQYGRARPDADPGVVERYVAQVRDLVGELYEVPSESLFGTAVAPRRADACAAIRYALSGGDARTALSIAARMGRFWLPKLALEEGKTYLSAVLEHDHDPPTEELAVARGALGGIVYAQGDHATAEKLFLSSVDAADAAGLPGARARAEVSRASIEVMRGHFDDAEQLALSALADLDPGAEPGAAARAHLVLGGIAANRLNPATAKAHWYEAAALFERAGSTGAMLNVTIAAIAEDHPALTAQQIATIEGAVARAREIGETNGEAAGLRLLGMVAADRGDDEHAMTHFREGLSSARRAGLPIMQLVMLSEIALSVLWRTEPLEFARVLSAMRALRRAITKSELPPPQAARHDEVIAAVRPSVGEAAFDAAWAEGESWTLPEVVGRVLA